MNRTELRREATTLFRANVKGGRVQWVWTWQGNYPTGREGCTGYFVHVKGDETMLWSAQWTRGYPLRVRSSNVLSWRALAASSGPVKGGKGRIPSPAEYGL